MPIYDILSSIKDAREHDGICSFNGFLEDYLAHHEAHIQEDQKEIWNHILIDHPNMKICVDLKLNINKDAIANQIISYRDSFKLPSGMIRCPYIIYANNQDAQRALLLSFGDKDAYVMAKALYFVLSEPENEYEGTRNEIISMNACSSMEHLLQDAIQRFFYKHEKAGIIQRELDLRVFANYDEMYECANAIATKQLIHLKDMLKESEDPEHTINQIIAIWFLMKKFSYVQYMMDKNALYKQHVGNVKKQRQAAKQKCESIGFVSYSELWKLVKELERDR